MNPWIPLAAGCILAAPIPAGAAAAEPAPELRLLLSPVTAIVHQGEDAALMLSIVGPEADAVLADTPGLVQPWGPSAAGLHGFQRGFQVRGDRVGKMTLGPYRVKFHGRELVSQTLSVLVLEKRDKQAPLKSALYLTDETIRLGDSVGMLLEYAHPEGRPLAELPRYDPALEVVPTSGFFWTPPGKSRPGTVASYSYMLTPTRKGRYVLSPATIEGLPEGLKFAARTLVVE